MKRFIILLAAALLLPLTAVAQSATMYKDPFCGCCTGHAEYLRENGFDVTIVETPPEKLAAIKEKHQVPPALQGCHTLLVKGYVVEGHVPVEAIEKLLAEEPDIIGVSLPGMPLGSPGMGGLKTAPFQIMTIGGDGGVFAEI